MNTIEFSDIERAIIFNAIAPEVHRLRRELKVKGASYQKALNEELEACRTVLNKLYIVDKGV